MEMFVGVGSIEGAGICLQRQRRWHPASCFIDEIDAIGKARGRRDIPVGEMMNGRAR